MEAYAAGEGSLAVVVALIAGSLAALLILGAEFFFIKDVFNNRMNTVFKLYYQAWILLAISGGFALYYMTTHWLRSKTVHLGWRASWSCAAVVILAAGLAYPVGATFARTDGLRPATPHRWPRLGEEAGRGRLRRGEVALRQR